MPISDPAFDYDKFGRQYSGQRQTDPRIAAFSNKALGAARTVLNVGAGAGSYEPDEGARFHLRVEIARRPALRIS